MHEGLLHADSFADGFMDDGWSNKPHLPKRFRNLGTHDDHYHISQGAIYDPDNATVKKFTVNGFNILKKASKNWNLNFSDTQIRTQMWNFHGSLVKVNAHTGKLEYKIE